MMYSCAQQTRQAYNRWLSPLLPSILVAESLLATVDPAPLASAAECQVTEAGGTSQGLMNWEDTTLRSLRLTITVDRDLYRGLISSPVREIAPYMNRGRMGLGKTEDQEIATFGVCMSQDIRESALFNQAMITTIGKTQAKTHKTIMKFPARPYNGKRHVHTIRTIPPEIGISVRKTARTIIGPVQELQKSILPDALSVSQALVALPPIVESPALFGGQSLIAAHPFQDTPQLPGNESLRMNLTTAQAMDDRNCVSGCP